MDMKVTNNCVCSFVGQSQSIKSPVSLSHDLIDGVEH